MADMTYSVQSLSSGGEGRVSVTLTQVNTNADPSAPFYGSSVSLNVSNADASSYEVNSKYTLALTPVTTPAP